MTSLPPYKAREIVQDSDSGSVIVNDYKTVPRSRVLFCVTLVGCAHFLRCSFPHFKRVTAL
jgi:hypothetical protein